VNAEDPGIGYEAALLRRAREMTNAAPARALELLQEHEVRFPRSALVQEREVLRIEALFRLGRSGQATALARGFPQKFPMSGHLPRVEELLRQFAGQP
jgi:hypothetical protein